MQCRTLMNAVQSNAIFTLMSRSIFLVCAPYWIILQIARTPHNSAVKAFLQSNATVEMKSPLPIFLSLCVMTKWADTRLLLLGGRIHLLTQLDLLLSMTHRIFQHSIPLRSSRAIGLMQNYLLFCNEWSVCCLIGLHSFILEHIGMGRMRSQLVGLVFPF